MQPELIALLMFGLLLVGLFMGHPLAFVLGGTAVLTAVITGKTMVLGIVINRVFGDVLDNYTLIAIPLFVLMARFLSDSGVTDRMFEALRLLLSNVRAASLWPWSSSRSCWPRRPASSARRSPSWA